MRNENDYELIYLAREKDENAINALYQKYKPLIEKKARYTARNVVNKGIEIEDLIQEAMIGFEEAIRNYKEDENTLFYTFACICIDRKINTYVRKIVGHKNKILNDAISFEYIDEDNETQSILNYICEDSSNPLHEFISKEHQEELYYKIKKDLTDFEDEVFNLKIQNFTIEEMVHILDKDNKSIYNALQRIREKIKKIGGI